MDAENLDALRTKEYWDNRYKNASLGEEFDWFKSYDDLAPWLTDLLHHDDGIVMLGCGNSVLTVSKVSIS
jgi:EEF1A lysine methyltransferase 4